MAAAYYLILPVIMCKKKPPSQSTQWNSTCEAVERRTLVEELFIFIVYLVNAVNLSWSYIPIPGVPNTVVDNSTRRHHG